MICIFLTTERPSLRNHAPAAVSYTVRQLEEWLAVPLFERRHRDVELTAAGAWFLKEGRSVVKKMDQQPAM
ncbi:LysR family transcriptional regulator, partial [Escherichia coli]|uniref:LysR family transcriptional regulator n=1 Tax=Escherichia coli TaxID=562 RepID=UPI003F4B6882